MKRTLLASLLAAMVLPTVAHAAALKTLTSHALHFTLRYPAGWRVLTTQAGGMAQVALSQGGVHPYSMTVALIPVRPGRTMAITLQRTAAYERSLGTSTFSSIHWTAAKVGGHAALAGVDRISTEGGVAMVDGVYLTTSGTRTYEIVMAAYNRPAPSSLNQFPAVYRTILSSWRFL